jgi:hypothetical protein
MLPAPPAAAGPCCCAAPRAARRRERGGPAAAAARAAGRPQRRAAAAIAGRSTPSARAGGAPLPAPARAPAVATAAARPAAPPAASSSACRPAWQRCRARARGGPAGPGGAARAPAAARWLLTLLVLDLGLDIVDGVGRLHLEGDSLAREGLDEDLHLAAARGGGRRGGRWSDRARQRARREPRGAQRPRNQRADGGGSGGSGAPLIEMLPWTSRRAGAARRAALLAKAGAGRPRRATRLMRLTPLGADPLPHLPNLTSTPPARRQRRHPRPQAPPGFAHPTRRAARFRPPPAADRALPAPRSPRALRPAGPPRPGAASLARTHERGGPVPTLPAPAARALLQQQAGAACCAAGPAPAQLS